MAGLSTSRDFIEIKTNARLLSAVLGEVAEEQIPYATAKALNDVAFATMRAEKGEMARVFELRNRFSQAGVQVNKADQADWPAMYAEVGIEERRSYLIDHVLGGKREGGRHGRAILEAEEMRSKSGRVPGGKRPGALIERAMRAKRQAELNSAFGARSRKKDKRLPFLIYSRKWGNEVLVRRKGADRYPLEIVYAFKRGVSIKRTFEMELVAQREVGASYYQAFNRALARAIATGKSRRERQLSDSIGVVIESGR